MAIDFPSPATNGQVFTSNGRSWSFSSSANAWLSADSTIGAGANAFSSATIAGANTAVGTGANTVGSAAFIQANAAVVNANLDSVNATRYVVFEDAVTGSFNRANVSYGFTFNPSTNTISTINAVATGNISMANSSSPIVLKENGRLTVGSVDEYSATTIVPKLQISATSFEDNIIGAFGWGTAPISVSAVSGVGATVGQQQIVSQGESLGEIRYFGSDGVNFIHAATIQASVDGTPGVDDMPGRLTFRTTAAGAFSPTIRMSIISTGNVGIGRTNPGHRLDVVGTINASNILINGGPLSVINANLDSVNATRYVVFDDAITGPLTRANVSHGLTYNPSTNTITSNTIVVTGNVGIGRTNPGFRLDVVGTINASNVLVNGAPLTASGGGGGANLISDTVSATRFVTFANNTTGTFTQANVSSSLTFNPSTGTLSATIFNSTSDINSKQNIKTIENGLNIINSLRGVSFDWKDTGKPSYGLIAQEVEQHVPALVDTDENGKKSLNYDAVIGFLVEAIKELKKNG